MIDGYIICPECNGEGEIEKNISYDGLLEADVMVVCILCNGDCKILKEEDL